MNRITLISTIIACFAGGQFASFEAKAQEASYDELTVFRLLQNQDYRGATDYLLAFYQRDSTDQAVLAQLAYSYRLANNLTEAEQFYRQLFRIDSTNVAVLS